MSNRNVSNGNTILLDDDSSYDGGGTSATINLGGSTIETQHVGGNTGPTIVNGEPGRGEETQLWTDVESPRRCCVGWLLVVEGPSKGCSREIYTGRNTVGRTSEIRIDGDAGVSGNQCVVTYDPRHNEYVLSNGAGHAITRVNDKRVDSSVELKSGDFIELSEKTTVRFIAACDDYFKW